MTTDINAIINAQAAAISRAQPGQSALDTRNTKHYYGFSDREMKTNIAALDSIAVLERLADIPITSWNYREIEPEAKHVGPMAQDFRAAFGLGTDDRTIAFLDASGVAMAAVQGLYQLVRAQGARIEALEADQDSHSLDARVSKGWKAH